MTLYKWSQTAAADATADPSINWQEGQAPSSINDSGRAMMAAIAKYRDDTSGSLVTSGSTSTAYILTTSQPFSSTSDLNGQELTFVVTPTNGANATLNVNSIGAYPLVTTANVPVAAGSLIDGSIYTATFSSALGCWKLRNFFVNPYNVPLGGMLDFIGSSVPNSNFVFPIGQAISRVTYATLFSLVGTTYGVGDGSTTFNVPDLTGRVTAMKEAVATRLTSAISGIDGATLGSASTAQFKTLVTANLPAYTPAGTISNGAITVNVPNTLSAYNTVAAGNFTSGSFGNGPAANPTASQAASTFTGTAQGGTSTPLSIVQPTMIVNKILRVI